MRHDDFERQEIDLLVSELTAKREGALPDSGDPRAIDGPASGVPLGVRPGSRWSQGSLAMPSARPVRLGTRLADGIGKRLARSSAFRFARRLRLPREASGPSSSESGASSRTSPPSRVVDWLAQLGDGLERLFEQAVRRCRFAALPRPLSIARLWRVPGPAMMVRFWVALGALYCASMTFWPYPKTYFWGMVLYLLSLGLVVVSGVWGARLSWDQRLGAAHTVALGTVLWAVTLAAEAVPPI